MVVGAFGSWSKDPFGVNVSGTDGSNHGWRVVIVAGASASLFALTRTRRIAGLWAILGGAAGLTVTLRDRDNITDIHNTSGCISTPVCGLTPGGALTSH